MSDQDEFEHYWQTHAFVGYPADCARAGWLACAERKDVALAELRAELNSIAYELSLYEQKTQRQAEELAELRQDKARLDWLADKDNPIGNVLLPADCVLDNPHSLRGAIDRAMRGQK